MDHRTYETGSSPQHIRHIEKAKTWAGVLGIILVVTIGRDVVHQYGEWRGEESWFFGTGQFRHGDRVIDNANESAETGIMITGNSHDLQERGKPRWIINAVGLLAVIQISRHLSKGYTMPALPGEPPTRPGIG